MNPPLITFISPTIGDWIIKSKFQQQIGAILYDPTSSDPDRHPSSLIILGWPYGRSYPKLKFTEVITDVEAAKVAIITKGPDKGNKKYIGIRTFLNSDIAIGTREERVLSIKQIENHPAVVEVTTSDAVELEVPINVTIEVLDPMPSLKIDDFLGYAAAFITEAYRNWASGKTFKENRAINTNDNPLINDEICDKIDSLNKEKFEPNGFIVKHLSVLRVAVAEKSKDVLEAEQTIVIEANKLLAAASTQQVELLKNETEEKKNATKLKLITGKLEAEANFITKTSNAQAKQNKAWGEGGLKTLIMNGTDSKQTQTIQVADAT